MNTKIYLNEFLSRRLVGLLVCLLPALMLTASPLTDKAAKAYHQELYTEALQLYQKAERTEGTSSALCCNIGDTYYSLKDTGRAIVYYERALLLDPGNADARFNLDFVRQKSGIGDEAGSSILSIWANKVACSFSSNVWATVGVISFLLCLLAVCLYVFMDEVLWRKVGFFGAIALLLVSVAANVCAFVNHSRAVNHSTAIVMSQQATLSNAPRTPKDKSEIAFELGMGRKVELLDSVLGKNQKWFYVESSNSRRGWINSSDVEII